MMITHQLIFAEYIPLYFRLLQNLVAGTYSAHFQLLSLLLPPLSIGLLLVACWAVTDPVYHSCSRELLSFHLCSATLSQTVILLRAQRIRPELLWSSLKWGKWNVNWLFSCSLRLWQTDWSSTVQYTVNSEWWYCTSTSTAPCVQWITLMLTQQFKGERSILELTWPALEKQVL